MSRRARTRACARRDEEGAAALEFALVLPLLLLIVFAIISYGYMFSVRQALTQAAAEGARAAAVAPSNQSTAATSAVNNALSGYSMTCGSGGLTCTPVQAACGSATCMSVTVSFAYRTHNPLPSLLPDAMIPATLSFKSSAEVN